MTAKPTAAHSSSTPSTAEDLRLLLPAVAAWAVTAGVLGLGPGHGPVLLAATGAAVLLAAVLLTRRPGGRPTREGARRPGTGVTVAAVLLVAAAATAVTLLHTADLHRGPVPALARAGGTAPEVTVELTVTGDPRTHASRTRGTAAGQTVLTVDAVVDRVFFPDVPTPAPRVASTRTHTPVTVLARGPDIDRWQLLLPSTRVAVEVDVRPPGEGHDDESAALLVVHGPPRELEPPSLPQRIAGRLREGLRSAADGLPADARGLLPGLVVGDTSRLPVDLLEAFRATDMAHLVAVSGANLAIVLGVLLGAPGQAATPERRGLAGFLGLTLRSTALLGTGVTLAFVTVCRPEPSVLRAAGTGLIGLLALATGRPRRALPALSGTVLLLVLLDPYLSRSLGFLLSVLATAGLLVLGPHWTATLRARGWPQHLAGAVGATAAAQALCAPVTVVLSGHISLVAVPCNLLAELAVAPATLLGFAVLVLEPLLPAPARLLAEVAGVPVGWLAAVARHGADLPGARLSWPGGLLGTVTLALGTVAVCWTVPLLVPRRVAAGGQRGGGRWARAAVAGLLFLVLLAVLLRPPVLTRLATGWPPPGWRLVMCDVGQGDMVVLPATGAVGDPPDSAVVVDAGPDPHAADRCLRELGITRVPLLLVTHFHADHVEGVPGVLRGRAVGAIEGTTVDDPPGEAAQVSGWAAASGVPLLRARRGERRSVGPWLSWEVVWPDTVPSPEATGANNASVALLATVAGGLRLALLGDLEPPAQSALLGRTGGGMQVDVLKVAHHGSAHQDWDLAAALGPRLALISCGEGNPYGHPSARTVDRLRSLGATVLRTDVAGDIAVTGDSPAHLGASVHPHALHGPRGARAARDVAEAGGPRGPPA
ncbi:ComEC/Rec2 family competence protein [Kitasatospora sp. A2-31]|uniref:ComEC/Rec2 family competence protein n=1 Tax=Kitasatospora sp. A2-31 TaxID=2916414 RepID=UPI001EE87967|nr:ComEC/Rec2 family competence protein [Kitasatospora sp. A2-31]MCG6493569.1 ComEC/Rec2 family competence protein [Kitasatospora sp. A2-31]